MIGTNRHESRRVDLQLRGRAGRQGDPGESRFFVSLEDDLLVRYGIEALIAGRVVSGHRDEPLDHPVLRGEIARAQRIIEGQNRRDSEDALALRVGHRRAAPPGHGRPASDPSR